jgi:hypothetical protein
MQRAFFARDSRFFISPLFLRGTEQLIDCAEHFIQVFEHLIVPESNNPIIPRLQKRSSNFIFLRKLGMLGSVQFDNKVLLDRAKVSEVGPYWVLTPELYLLHPAASQVSPQNSFSVGLFATQPSSVPLR